MKHECIIGLGSNINAQQNFAAAIDIIRLEHEVLQISNWVKTAPIGIVDQPDFLNGALKVNTTLSHSEFQTFLKTIEDRLKRDRTAPKFGPRTIDLDIVKWDGNVIDPDYFTRDFLKQLVDEVS
jgi:2-amino-4-hydroxy-6-hydroxymethyldihydropteridine diphosphokinase